MGLLPDEHVRQRMTDEVGRLRVAHDVQGRWIKPDRYHMTLHFLGAFSEVPEELVSRACQGVAELRMPEFDLVLDRVGHFAQGVGWLGCAQIDVRLQQLWEGLRMALTREHVRIQGHAAFKPHVTVLRDARQGLPAGPIDPIVWPVRDFALIDSQLGSRNEYVVVQRWSLL
ncbi:RNA 2',3'-cyclic phosphodiesterase [Lysobacter tyrosinilyticus]